MESHLEPHRETSQRWGNRGVKVFAATPIVSLTLIETVLTSRPCSAVGLGLLGACIYANTIYNICMVFILASLMWCSEAPYPKNIHCRVRGSNDLVTCPDDPGKV